MLAMNWNARIGRSRPSGGQITCMTRKLVLLALAMLLVLSGTHAVAGKKKLKPWKSETATIAVANPDDMINVTIQEFMKTCAVPATQGFDAAIFEVPAEYQKVAASASAIGSSFVLRDLDMYFYDASCRLVSAAATGEADEIGWYMLRGTTWIAVLNFKGDPNVSVHIELKDDVPAPHAVAGEQKTKSWKSETVTIAVAHPAYGATGGQLENVTVQEFREKCAVPATQGFDAAIFEVPAEYQKVAASASAIGSSFVLRDLDMYFYDASCRLVSAAATGEADEIGWYMLRGTTWIAVLNFKGDPNVSVHIELKVY